MRALLKLKTMALGATLACAFATSVHAAFITNGGFEAAFSGWTRLDQLGSDGTFALQTGTASPVNADPVPAPSGGSTAAMTDSQGPGSHVLYQTFTPVGPVSSAALVFDLFIGNRATTFVTPNTLDFAIATIPPVLNQQARVDILLAGADPFSLAAGDVLLNLFRTNVGDPPVSGYNHYSSDVTALLNSHLNTPLILRFAETDNVLTFQFGVDNVDIQAGVSQIPEPSSWVLMLSALAGVGWLAEYRAKYGCS